MNRLIDKAIVTLCCLALLALGPVGAEQIGWLCLMLAASALAEVVPTRCRTAIALATLACCAVFPTAGAFLPLAAYDAVRCPARIKPVGAALLVVAAVACIRTEAILTALLTCLFLVAAALLSLRTAQAEETAAANRRTRDELQERALSLATKNRDLIDRQGYEVELATLAERARIAREIHDNVGHLLTRATLQVEALRVVHAGEPRVQADFADVGKTLNEALDTVRASVHALNDDACDLSVQMQKAVEGIAANSGLSVDLDVSCERVPANISSCLIAVAREAISNTLRHAAASALSIRCLEHPSFYQLIVTDNGEGKGSGSEAPGMGLTSMRERVEALGGTFTAGPVPDGGWRVFATVPKGRSITSNGSNGAASRKDER